MTESDRDRLAELKKVLNEAKIDPNPITPLEVIEALLPPYKFIRQEDGKIIVKPKT